ncbi:MBL fold metallo-hydrolase [Candidatus Woesearchaeota archaeon]|nr:MBL fold metallo-hydrolase [Candidatus Woesearchaeota archaeon]
MEIAVLASGSSGNCTYVSTGKTSVLFDAGISARQVKQRLSLLGKSLASIDAIVVSHEHIDHVRGLPVLSRSGASVFVRKKTHRALPCSLGVIDHCSFFHKDQFSIGDLQITPLEILHDASDPCCFMVQQQDKILGIITDLGNADGQIKDLIAKAHGLVLEANHDEEMLLTGPYPYHLKQRILGEYGHLSNATSANLVLQHATPTLRHIFLAHLSLVNNTPELVLTTFQSALAKRNDLKIMLTMTHREKPTTLLEL